MLTGIVAPLMAKDRIRTGTRLIAPISLAEDAQCQ